MLQYQDWALQKSQTVEKQLRKLFFELSEGFPNKDYSNVILISLIGKTLKVMWDSNLRPTILTV